MMGYDTHQTNQMGTRGLPPPHTDDVTRKKSDDDEKTTWSLRNHDVTRDYVTSLGEEL